jgi:hypothetical protein
MAARDIIRNVEIVNSRTCRKGEAEEEERKEEQSRTTKELERYEVRPIQSKGCIRERSITCGFAVACQFAGCNRGD